MGFIRTKTLFLLLCAAVAVYVAGGCSPAHYKADADKEVYNIIDKKWQDQFGKKTNYKISDTMPSPGDIQSQDYMPADGKINLAQAVAIATANNRNYQSQKESLYLSALGLTGVRHQYAAKWYGTIDAKHRNFDGQETNAVAASTGVDKTTIVGNGILVNTGLAIDWVHFLSDDPKTTLASVLSGNLDVPLLGTGGKVALEDLTQAERSVLYDIRSFSLYRKSFVVSIITDYYKILQQRDSVTNAENNYQRVVESRDRLYMETQAGRRDRFELDRAETQVLNAQNDSVVAQQDYESQLDQFKIRLALPTDANITLEQDELSALEQMGVSKPTYTLDQAIEIALLRRLDLATSQDQIADSARKAQLAAEGLGVQLDLTASANVPSKPKTDFENLQFHHGDYQVGLEADLPFDRKSERNVYRRALIELTRQQRKYDNDQEMVILNVRDSFRTLEESAERYRIQTRNLEVAKQRVECTTMLLEAGQIQAEELLNSQDALINAENSVTDALVKHAIAKLNFFLDIGILEVKPDGMWEQANNGQ